MINSRNVVGARQIRRKFKLNLSVRSQAAVNNLSKIRPLLAELSAYPFI